MSINLICIDNNFVKERGDGAGDDEVSFILHKTYELHEETIEENGNDIKYIIAEDGIYWLYDKKYFITIEEWRERQINKIL